MPTFEQEYGKLNDAQRRAVDTIEGPVMVVAGPGTGKTQVLALRVANIIDKTQYGPSNILCLTFSTAGATAMRERLRTIIGGEAYRVTVSTVHGFCDNIIRRYPSLFSEWSERKPLSDLDRYRAFQRIIDEISHESALINPKNPYDRIPGIIGRISDCKREGKSLEDLEKVADEYEVQMAGKSKEGTKVHRNNLLAARKFREFVELFRRYQAFLEEQELYDYDDMILTVIQALREEEWLLQNLQERYQYFLVDEAQDLNGAQWKVIELLTTYEHVPHDPNFFLVGDDDQSIYRFQGANLEHMLAFRERFPAAAVIVLTENYRSTQSILDAAGRLIAHNEERLIGRMPDLTKDLQAHTAETGPCEPLLLRPPSDSAELWLIADLCEERIAQGVPPQEIAVLTQTNHELFPIYDVLRARGIPVILNGKSDLLTHAIVSQALVILRSLLDHGDRAFLSALACECLECHPADLARVSFAARKEERSAQELLLQIEGTELPLTDPPALLRARDILLDLREREASRTVLETVEQTLRTTGLTPTNDDADPLDLAAIEAFFHHVKQVCLEHPTLSLGAFLSDLDLYADDAYAQLRLSYTMPHLVSEGVQLLTAHHSKGLEYHTVILSQFREGHWDERRPPHNLAVPEELLFGWESEQKRFEKHQDERRVAYVAMTRAKRELLMLCPREFAVGERARPVAPSGFFAEAGPLPEADAALKQPERASLLLLHPPRAMDAEQQAYLRERLETFSLSASTLTAFLRNPEEFKRVHLLGIPEQFTEDSLRAMGYGNAVHWALRDWAASMQQGTPLALDAFLASFERNLRERNVLTEGQIRDLLSVGRAALPPFFAEKMEGKSPVIHAIERGYQGMIGDIPIKGKIDRIDLVSVTSGDAIVYDYKTGSPKAPAVIRGGAEEGTVSRTEDGDYFRQLVFYALLLEQAEPLLTPQNFVLTFVGERGEDPIDRPFVIAESEKESLRTLIKTVWAKITALDFTPIESEKRSTVEQ